MFTMYHGRVFWALIGAVFSRQPQTAVVDVGKGRPLERPRHMAAHANLGTGRPAEQDYGFLRPAKKQPVAGPKPLTQTDVEFLSRMDGDVDERRRTSFIIELSACHRARARAQHCSLPSLTRLLPPCHQRKTRASNHRCSSHRAPNSRR